MQPDDERAFSAAGPVGRYWLRNCVGFQVKGLRGGSGIVEEIGLGPDGVDVLAVRRRNVLLPGLTLVPANRVESVHPWEDTLVLASRSRRERDQRREQARHAAHRMEGLARVTAVESGHALRDGAVVVYRGLAALGALLLGLLVLARKHALPLAAAYVAAAKRAWNDERDAISAWRAARRGAAEEPGDDGPLTRAGADDADARRRETLRRF
jgi:hypothetical protein